MRLFDPSIIGIIGTGIISSILLIFWFAHITKIVSEYGPKKEKEYIAKTTMIYLVIWPIILFIGRFTWNIDIFETENLWKISIICILGPYFVILFLYRLDAFRSISW